MFAGIQGISYSSSLEMLKVCIFIYGVGAGVINGSTNAVVADISVDNKGADLSLLGFFFGIGALGMPLLLGLLSGRMQHLQVVAAVGWLTLSAGLLYVFTRFPPAKRGDADTVKGAAGAGKSIWSQLSNSLLVLIALFLFFQSSLEAIINNWTTTYLIARGVMTDSNALYALSLHILGMTVMRLLTGSVFRRLSQITILWFSLLLLGMGIFLMQAGTSMSVIVAGLVFSGAGIAGGFPIMLGFVGERFAGISGTAFSFVFVIALIGNMLINYLMGLIVHAYGVTELTSVCYSELLIMAALCVFIFRKFESTQK
jgi:fucose permease